MKLYFRVPRFVLYHGDSLALLPEFDENSVDLIFADPPYFLSNGTFTCHAGRGVSVKKGDWDLGEDLQKNFHFHLDWIKACKRVLKPNASPNLSCRYFTASHETLIWAKKDKKAKHTFNYDLAKNGNWPEDHLKRNGSQMRSVWSLISPNQSERIFAKYPTQKSFHLLKRVILLASNEGDIVLDPFCTSSGAGIASYKLGRRFIGIDTGKRAWSKKQIRIFSKEQIKNIGIRLLCE